MEGPRARDGFQHVLHAWTRCYVNGSRRAAALCLATRHGALGDPAISPGQTSIFTVQPHAVSRRPWRGFQGWRAAMLRATRHLGFGGWLSGRSCLFDCFRSVSRRQGAFLDRTSAYLALHLFLNRFSTQANADSRKTAEDHRSHNSPERTTMPPPVYMFDWRWISRLMDPVRPQDLACNGLPISIQGHDSSRCCPHQSPHRVPISHWPGQRATVCSIAEHQLKPSPRASH